MEVQGLITARQVTSSPGAPVFTNVSGLTTPPPSCADTRWGGRAGHALLLVHRPINTAHVLPALDAPGFDLLLDARVKCAFVGGLCQMTPSARPYMHAIHATVH